MMEEGRRKRGFGESICTLLFTFGIPSALSHDDKSFEYLVEALATISCILLETTQRKFLE